MYSAKPLISNETKPPCDQNSMTNSFKVNKHRHFLGVFDGCRSNQSLQELVSTSLTPSPHKGDWDGVKERSSEGSECEWSLSDFGEIPTKIPGNLVSTFPKNIKSSMKRFRFSRDLFSFGRKQSSASISEDSQDRKPYRRRSEEIGPVADDVYSECGGSHPDKTITLISNGSVKRVVFPAQQKLTAAQLKTVFLLLFGAPNIDGTRDSFSQWLYMLDNYRQSLTQLKNSDPIPSGSVILCEYVGEVTTTTRSSLSVVSSTTDQHTPTDTSSLSFLDLDMSNNRLASEANTNTQAPTTRQNSPQHKICLVRNKSDHPQQLPLVQIPVYLNEAQIALLNAKHTIKEVSRPLSTDQGKVTITTAKSGTNIAMSTSTVYQQQLLTQHLQQHQAHNYLQQATVSNAPGAPCNDHSNSAASGDSLSYLIAPNLVVSRNQLSQLTPRDLAILQQKLIYQQHLYQHHQQQQMIVTSTSNQHLTCTCPSELHQAMHIQQQQQQRDLDNRMLMAAQLSLMHGGSQVRVEPVSASTLPRELHSSSNCMRPSLRSNGSYPKAGVNKESHECQNHQVSILRQVEMSDKDIAVSGVSTLKENSFVKEVHTYSLNNSVDSNKEQPMTETDSQIMNLITWIESVYGVKLIDYISKNSPQQRQDKCQSDKSLEINGKLLSGLDPQRLRQTISEARNDLDDVRQSLKRQHIFFRESLDQISSFIQNQGSQNISERVKVLEYDEAVLAHKIQTVHSTLSSYLSSEEWYPSETIDNLSRNVSDINEDYIKLQENYRLTEKPINLTIEYNNQCLEQHQSILTMVSKAMVASQSQLNSVNHVMTELIRKQSLMKPSRKIASLPEEALESVITLREEIHHAILNLTPDLGKRLSAYEFLEQYLKEKRHRLISDEDRGTLYDVTTNIPLTSHYVSSITNYGENLLTLPPSIETGGEAHIYMAVSGHHISNLADSIPMIDETDDSYDESGYYEPAMISVQSSSLGHRVNYKYDDPRTSHRSGTILKSHSGLRTLKTNKVVFCTTVTVEDGSETIRLNCLSEESDCDEAQDQDKSFNDHVIGRKNPLPPPPPRRSKQDAIVIDNPDGEVNYEDLESFTSDMKHHGLHRSLVCVPLLGTTENSDRGVRTVMKTGQVKGSSNNDIWQRQTEFNTTAARNVQGAPGGTTMGESNNFTQKIKQEKPIKKK